MSKKSLFIISLFLLILFVFNSCITVVFPEDDNDDNNFKNKYLKGKFQVYAGKMKDKYHLTDSRNRKYMLVGLNNHQEEQLRHRDGKWITAKIKVLERVTPTVLNARLIQIY